MSGIWKHSKIPNFFDSKAFRNLGPEYKARAITAAYRLKNLYAMNNNGARNLALEDGRKDAKWILPWDGNCFLTDQAWKELTQAVEADSQRRYFVVPMQRITNNAVLFHEAFKPNPLEEPQILFRADAKERFNEALPYGRRPKVELFWRLGIPGQWEKWADDPWDQKRRTLGREAGFASVAGWVARLASGVGELERQGSRNSFRNRGKARDIAIRAAIDFVDAQIGGRANFPAFYCEKALDMAQKAQLSSSDAAIKNLASDLVAGAEKALTEGAFSVVNKTTLPPSGDLQDYWHPAPYWWPNPETADGLPYVQVDGKRIPGTRLYEPESEKYDRTSLQRMFDNTALCALAWRVTGRQDFAKHGALLLRTWFLDPETRMNPHLNYAQVQMGHNGNRGTSFGVIEFKDVYFFLDAVRLLEKSGQLNAREHDAFKAWLQTYYEWLNTSDQGQRELISENNHGTYFDLQAISIAAFLGIEEDVQRIYFRALSRLNRQITDNGEQPEELKRTLSQHYVVFNLQGFLNIFRIARAAGRPLTGAETCGQKLMSRALAWIFSQDHDNWPYEQIEPFDKDRLFPLLHAADSLGLEGELELGGAYLAQDYMRIKSIFNPHHAIHPFWNIEGISPQKKIKNKRQKNTGFNLAANAMTPAKLASDFYPKSPADELPNTYILYRIIGNDLFPRHQKGQSYDNVKFILENEPDFENCEKRWIVNRIIDADEQERIISLLKEHSQKYKVIPFITEEYRRIGWDFESFQDPCFFESTEFKELETTQKLRTITAAYRLKNLYTMNVNGARNTALEDGRGDAKWILPWDGNCFLTSRAWKDLTKSVEADSLRRYFVVPVQRISDNAVLLTEDFEPDPQEEPQILFRTDAEERFNPEFSYGRRDKVELLWRLSVPGHWDKWRDAIWDPMRRPLSREAGLASVAGWTARLASGMPELERQKDKASFKARGEVRDHAIRMTIDLVDCKLDGQATIPVFYKNSALDIAQNALKNDSDSAIGQLASNLVVHAEQALTEGVFSVTDKTTLAPSGDIHDYWNVAPYWWPNPETKDGLPYIRRDGERVPGTLLQEDESSRYDHASLHRMLDNTTLCALAWRITGRKEFAEHGVKMLRTWFLAPETRMNPHMNYAQVQMGRNENHGVPQGIIEFRNIYYFLDAVKLLKISGQINESEHIAFTAWLRKYRDWLHESDIGQKSVGKKNNLGTYYDLQAISIAAFLGDDDDVREIYFRALSRLHRQILDSGAQPDELKRTQSQHYVVFNLQGFLNIFRIARAAGRPLLGAEACGQNLMSKALAWIFSQDHENWPHEQRESFDKDRLFPLLHAARSLSLTGEIELGERYLKADFLQVKPVFNPHHTVHPFWNIDDTSL